MLNRDWQVLRTNKECGGWSTMRKGQLSEMKFEKEAGAGSLGHVKEFGLYSISNGKLL